MIQEFKIRNVLSFKNEVTFSFVASNDQFAEDSQVVKINDNTRLLRFGVLYGYNASGKSNLLYAFDFLPRFWSYKPDGMDEPTGVVPFKLDAVSPNEPSCLELIFFVGNVKYWYQLELDRNQVYLEKLSYYKSAQLTMLFERKLVDGHSEVEINPKGDKISASAKELINGYCLKNLSFFVARNQVNASLPLIDAAKNWMKEQTMPAVFPTTYLTDYAQRKTAENKDLTKYLVDFLHEADFNITNISSDIVNRQMSDEEVKFRISDESIPKDERERIKKEKTISLLHTSFEHTVENENGREAYQMNRGDESTGTLRTFGIETVFYEALAKNAFLPIDEIETSQHPRLLEKMLFEYLRTHSRSQLLVTTHNDGLLDLVDDLIRKDSVWFTEKDKAGVTDLYKLTDFRGVNRLSSIREAYRNKRFGATMK